jgi:hypothetical protein
VHYVEHTGTFNICLPTRFKDADFDSLTHMCEVLRAVDVCACVRVACVSLGCVWAELPSSVLARLY